MGDPSATLLRRRGRLPCAELLPIVDQLALVLGAAQRAGIVHRDVRARPAGLRNASSLVTHLDRAVARAKRQAAVPVLVPPASPRPPGRRAARAVENVDRVILERVPHELAEESCALPLGLLPGEHEA